MFNKKSNEKTIETQSETIRSLAQQLAAATAEARQSQENCDRIRREAENDRTNLNARIDQLHGYLAAIGIDVAVLDTGFWVTNVLDRMRIDIQTARNGEPDQIYDAIMTVAHNVAPSAVHH